MTLCKCLKLKTTQPKDSSVGRVSYAKSVTSLQQAIAVASMLLAKEESGRLNWMISLFPKVLAATIAATLARMFSFMYPGVLGSMGFSLDDKNWLEYAGNFSGDN